MHRRTYLATAVAGLSALSGCSDGRDCDVGPCGDPGFDERFEPYGQVRCGFEGAPIPPATDGEVRGIDGSWRSARADAASTAANLAATPPDGCPRTRWRYEFTPDSDDRIEYTSTLYTVGGAPAVDGGSVFAADWEHSVHVLDARTGRLRWRYRTDVGGSSPGVTLTDDTLYVPRGGWVDAVDRRSRERRWRHSGGLSTPLVAVDDGLYAGTLGGDVWRRTTATGRRVWEVQAPSRSETPTGSPDEYAQAVTGLAVVDDFVLVAVRSGTVIALDRATGAEQWSTIVGEAVYDPIAAADGLLYCNAFGTLTALSVTDGTVVWRHPDRTVRGAPTVANGRVYIGTGSYGRATLSAFDAAGGTERWNSVASAGSHAEPSVGGDTVYVSTESFVLAVDAATGELRWGVEGFGSSGVVSAVGGAAFVGDRWGHVYALA